MESQEQQQQQQQLQHLQSELESARANAQRQTIESEEVLHDLNQRLQEAELRLQHHVQLVESVQVKSSQHQQRVQQLERELRVERETKDGAESAVKSLKTVEENAARERRDLLGTIDQSQAETQSVKGVFFLPCYAGSPGAPYVKPHTDID